MLAHANPRQVAAAGVVSATSTAATLPRESSESARKVRIATWTPSAGHVRHLPGGRAPTYL